MAINLNYFFVDQNIMDNTIYIQLKTKIASNESYLTNGRQEYLTKDKKTDIC